MGVTDLLDTLRHELAPRYTVEREVGRGGMAYVYLARRSGEAEPVALKVLRPELAAAVGGERFRREVTIATHLTHPGIVPLLDSGEAAGLPYYVMPYIAGESLRERMDRERQLPIDDALAITRQVITALSFAHREGFVHRDIKPENILFQSGSAVLTDFGIARAVTAAGGAKLTSTGIAVGTPQYMSPEQAAADPNIDHRSDIYGLGCVLYEMLSGEPPFRGATAQAILARQSIDPVPPLRTVRATIPVHVEQAIFKALAKVPADRFATADEFADAITHAPLFPPMRGRRRLAWIAGVATALIAGGSWLDLKFRSPLSANIASLAVLPPTAPAADTALRQLAQNLVVTLSTNLNGVGDLHAIDALTLLAQTLGKDYTPDQGAALGRRLGARSVVTGTLSRDGANVRLDLGVYASANAAPLARAFVLAPAESLSALTDSATWALLRQLWRTGTPPTPSIAAVTTHSIPSLRAFLDGERAIIDNRWPDAEHAFGEAVRQDSTFWLAYFRLAYAKGWQLHNVDSAAMAPARRHRQELPEPERMLLLGRISDSSAFDRLRELTDRYPDYWLGWFERADRLSHAGPLLGHPIEESFEFFRRALELNPRLTPAWTHQLLLALRVDSLDLAERSHQAVAAMGEAEDLAVVHRALADLIQGRTVPARIDSCVALALSQLDPEDQRYSPYWFSIDGHPAAQVAFSQAVLARGALPNTARMHRAGLAYAWAARGAWDSALVALDRISAQERDTTASFNTFRLAALGAWLGAIDPAVARRRRALINTSNASRDLRDAIAWYDGLTAIAASDSAGFATARRQLAPADTSRRGAYSRTLALLWQGQHGSSRAAAESLAAMAYHEDYWHGPSFMGVTRLAAARWLATDDPDRAAPLLYWPTAAAGFGPGWYQPAVAFDGLTALQAARIDAARGQTERARHEYQRFLRQYDMPVPSMRHLVNEAKAELGRLQVPREQR